MNKINLLWCTIRTSNFPIFYSNWYKATKIKERVKVHVLVSTQSEEDYLKKYFESINQDFRIVVFNPPYPGVCLPSYKLSSTLEYDENDIIVFGSDDFTPPNEWDEYLINKLKGKKGVLFVRDGYQAPDSSNMLHPAITIPIMKGSALTAMNKIIYNPVYHHMFSDCELYLVAKDMGLLIDDRIKDSTTFEHHHHAAGKRQADNFDRSYYQNWKMDELTWHNRKFLPTREKIILINANQD